MEGVVDVMKPVAHVDGEYSSHVKINLVLTDVFRNKRVFFSELVFYTRLLEEMCVIHREI